MSSPTPSPDEAGPRTALAEALQGLGANVFLRAEIDAILTALSERGYTIVASDRLAGLEAALAGGIADHYDDGHDPEQCNNLAWHDARAALSREATEKGAPRE